MIDNTKRLKIPVDEKRFIMPEVRERLFVDLINEYEKRCPNLTLLYAYLNKDSSKPLDYILLFKTRNTSNTLDLIVYDCPIIYSDHSIPGYRYCKREGLLDDFFTETTEQMVRLPEIRFKEIIEPFTGAEYSLEDDDPDSETSWRNEKYTNDVVDRLLDMSTRYVKGK